MAGRVREGSLSSAARVQGKQVRQATGYEPYQLTAMQYAKVIDPENARWRIGYRDDDQHREWVRAALIYDPDKIPDEVLRDYADSEPSAMNELISRRQGGPHVPTVKTESRKMGPFEKAVEFAIVTEDHTVGQIARTLTEKGAKVDYWRTTDGGHRVGFQGTPGKGTPVAGNPHVLGGGKPTKPGKDRKAKQRKARAGKVRRWTGKYVKGAKGQKVKQYIWVNKGSKKASAARAAGKYKKGA